MLGDTTGNQEVAELHGSFSIVTGLAAACNDKPVERGDLRRIKACLISSFGLLARLPSSLRIGVNYPKAPFRDIH